MYAKAVSVFPTSGRSGATKHPGACYSVCIRGRQMAPNPTFCSVVTADLTRLAGNVIVEVRRFDKLQQYFARYSGSAFASGLSRAAACSAVIAILRPESATNRQTAKMPQQKAHTSAQTGGAA
jgi:hypothetical protein